MAVVPGGLLDQVRDDVPQRDRLARVAHGYRPSVPVARGDDIVGVGCLAGVLVKTLGEWAAQPVAAPP
jgi:hypothetical protein